MKCNKCGGEWTPPKNISLTICPFCSAPVIDTTNKLDTLQPYEIIKHIVEKYGADIFSNGKKLSALLMDLIEEKTKERNILCIAINAGIANRILSTKNLDISHKRLVFKQCRLILCEDYGMSEKWSAFAVDCFVYALGWEDNVKSNMNKTVSKEQGLPYNKLKSNSTILNSKSDSSNSLKDIVSNNNIKTENSVLTGNSDNSESFASKIFKRYKDLKSFAISSSEPAVAIDIFEKFIDSESITIPNNINSIDSKAFENYKNLKNIEIPNSVTSIGYEAFKGCKNLTTISIPASINSIGDGAFKGCLKLTDINVDRKNTKYSSKNGMLFNYDKTKLLSYPSAIIADIPKGVTYIGNSAFSDCKNLRSIIIPSTVKVIEYNAFWGCINLTNIIVDKKNAYYSSKSGMIFDFFETKLLSYPSAIIANIYKNIIHIGYGAFGCCSNLSSVVLANSVASIGNYAFEGCEGLKNITIPYSVTSIGDSAFDGCINLKSIIIDERNMKYSSSDGMLFNYDKTVLFSYPSAVSVNNIPNSVTYIRDNAFLGCKNLKNITLPNNITYIGYMAFGGCENLTTISIPDSVNYIGNYAFVNCDNLTVHCNNNSYTKRYCIENNIKTHI